MMFTCCCCGFDFEEDEVEEVVVGIEGTFDFMCKLCFHERCDCPAPKYVLEPEHLTDRDEDYSPEAFEVHDG